MGDSAGYPPLRADECVNRMKELKRRYGGTSVGDSTGYSPLRADECRYERLNITLLYKLRLTYHYVFHYYYHYLLQLLTLL